MDFKLLGTVFITIFVAEIADKTQIATLLYASNAQANKLTVFAGSATALVLTSALAVFAGTMLSHWINPKTMARLAGLAFVLVGLWTFLRA